VSQYLIKEIFGPTLQGEGAHAGRTCTFLRFAACNLACSWCDTDFSPRGAERLSAAEIARRLVELDRPGSRMVVVTGGEPTLQWDAEIAEAISDRGFRVHMETNGTRVLAAAVDWLTVSPKPRFHTGDLALVPGDALSPSECKVVVDEAVDIDLLDRFAAHYRECKHWFLQPCAGSGYRESMARTVDLALKRPQWRVSLQLHKVIGLP
jgi:organic radical activating enzyme